jgi:sec-independent protein translocase protein TatA
VFNVGPLELIVVLIIALIVLGPQRLPDVARSLGRGMREFRSALDRPDEDDEPEEEPSAVEEEPGALEDEPSAVEEPQETLERYQKEADSSEPSSSSSDRV